MKIYKTKLFARWARKEKLSDQKLVQAVDEISRGLFDAKLASGVFKKRIAAFGQGKRGGFRTILAFEMDDMAFFIYGYAKNQKDNISNLELEKLKKIANLFLNYSLEEIKRALDNQIVIEVSL